MLIFAAQPSPRGTPYIMSAMMRMMDLRIESLLLGEEPATRPRVAPPGDTASSLASLPAGSDGPSPLEPIHPHAADQYRFPGYCFVSLAKFLKTLATSFDPRSTG